MSNQSTRARSHVTAAIVTLLLTLMSAGLTVRGRQPATDLPRDLPPDESSDRELTGTETHRYKVNLPADEFFQVRVEQKGADVSLSLSDAAGRVVAAFDSPNGKEGPERLSFIAKRAGSFVLAVSGIDPKAGKGSYTISRETPRPANARDRRRIEVEQIANECFAQGGTKDVAVRAKLIATCKESVRGWEELEDLYLIGLASRELDRLQRLQWRETRDEERVKAMDAAVPAPADKPVTRALSDEDGYHGYVVRLVAGSVLHVSLRELGTNVYVTLGKYQKPLSKEPLIWSNFNTSRGREIATLVAPETADYIILLSAVGGLPLRGSYELITRVSEKATDDDLLRVRAEKLNRETIGLSNSVTAAGLQKALAGKKEEAEIWQKVGEPYFAAMAENKLGLIYYDLGERHQAHEHYRKALRLWELVGDEVGKGNTLNNIGNVYLALQDKKQALDYYQQALVLLRKSGDGAGEANTLTNIGLAYAALDEKKKALDFYLQALPLRRATGERAGEAVTRSYIGTIYYALGEYGKMLETYKEVLLFAQGFYDRRREATALHQIGLSYSLLGDQQKALGFYQQALALRQTLGMRREEAGTLTNMGSIYVGLGDKQKGAEYLTRALAVFRAEGSRTGEGVALSNLAGIYFETGEPQKGWESLRQALPLFVATNEKPRELKVLHELSARYKSSNLVNPAVFFGKLSVNKIQGLRQGMEDLDPDTQKSFLRSVEAAYQGLADLLLDDDRPGQAVEVLNLYRDQQFLDFDRGSTERARLLPLSPREAAAAERYQQHSERIRKSVVQLEELKFKIGVREANEQEAAQRERLQAEYKEAFAALLRTLEEVPAELSGPRGELDEVPEAADVKQMQAAIGEVSAATGRRAVALYTLVTEKQLRLMLITPDGLKTFVSPVKKDELSETVLKFYAVLQDRERDPRPLGKRLYDMMLKPAEAELQRLNVQTILWGLDGNLRYIPTAALSPDGVGYLVERYQNVLFTRSNPERMTRATSPAWTGVGFGSSRPQTVALAGEGTQVYFPGLPGVITELEGIFGSRQAKGILPGSSFADDRFTKTAFYGALQARRPVVHISGHFSFRPGDSSHSFLILGDGKPLSLDELKKQPRLFEGVELLTLSACNTAANQPDASGREVDGFAELVQRMGASAVIATLWEVSDNSTPVLMREFYRNREKSREGTKAEALRQGQLALLTGAMMAKPPATARKGYGSGKIKLMVVPNDAKELHTPAANSQIIYVAQKDAPLFERRKASPFAHPFYWAPFILIGNWR